MVREAFRKLTSPDLPGRVLRSRPVRDYFWMTLGMLVTAFALDAFLIPNKIAAGGVSGLATVIFYALKDHGLPTVPVGLQMLIMNIGLLAIGIRARGWRYGAKTIYGAVGLSLAIDLMAPFVQPLATDDQLLAVLWGGALAGIGMGMVFRVGGNTGGTDIIAQLLTKKVSLGVGQLMLSVDACVLLLAGLVLGPNLALYGAIAVFVTGTTIDVVQEGLSTEKAAYIFSLKSEEIGQAILRELGRGATGFAARGLYTGDPREVIFCVVSRRELDDLKHIVHTLDPDAFLVISDVHEALGEGFKEARIRR
ncbi:MAG: YitT family protein [Coriobacteriia bacterium]|nr:YitT family protein [Coriobacteriia bacterium]